ncbi:MAG TPA: tRNA threonylcarbamoyladenosine dehydratase, partial [Bacillota bacterium]|nr:tRNA threonylcarbamoyladenosine dehydratase [Bacillota bacterium]
EGLAKLSSARVAVVGLGGVGSYTLEALARAGVGWLIPVDFDEICLTNTNRQIHALQGTYGKSKVEVMEERVKAINPEAVVVGWKEFLVPENIETILHGRISYVVDAIDTVWSKVALIKYCRENLIPIISVMGTGNKFDPLAFKVDDISKTHTCPLAKSVRKALRDSGIERGVKVVYSTEVPCESKSEVLTCHTGCICPNHGEDQAWNCTKRRKIPGSTSYLPPIAGLIAAGVVIQDLLEEKSVEMANE